MARSKQAPAHERMRANGKTQLAFWLPQEEADLLKRAAGIEDRSVSVYLRRAGKAAAEKTIAKITKD